MFAYILLLAFLTYSSVPLNKDKFLNQLLILHLVSGEDIYSFATIY